MKLWQYVRHPVATLDDWWSNASRDVRLDRNPVYLCVLIGVAAPSLAVVLVGPVPNSALTALTGTTQIVLCAFIFGGSCIMLYASFRFPGDRRKLAYRRGYTFTPLVVSGLIVYGITILANTPNFMAALSGFLTPMLAVGIAFQGMRLWLESRRIQRTEETLLDMKKRGER